MERPRRLHLHGPGRAGCSLARMLDARGVALIGASGGREEHLPEVRAALGEGVPWSPELPPLPAETLLLVGVPDDVLQQVLLDLPVERLPEREGLVMHLCGARGLEVFPEAWPEDLVLAAFHPLRSFPTRTGPVEGGLGGCLVALETRREQDLPLLEDLARLVGGRPVRLPRGSRAGWHLGAAVLANGLVGLFDLALRVHGAVGVGEEDARAGLATLAHQVLDNVERMGPERALTGPVARGDVRVLSDHLRTLADVAARDERFYEELLAMLARLAERGGRAEAARRVRALLERGAS